MPATIDQFRFKCSSLVSEKRARLRELHEEPRTVICNIAILSHKACDTIHHILPFACATLIAALVAMMNEQHSPAGAPLAKHSFVDKRPTFGLILLSRPAKRGNIVDYDQIEPLEWKSNSWLVIGGRVRLRRSTWPILGAAELLLHVNICQHLSQFSNSSVTCAGHRRFSPTCVFVDFFCSLTCIQNLRQVCVQYVPEACRQFSAEEPLTSRGT